LYWRSDENIIMKISLKSEKRDVEKSYFSLLCPNLALFNPKPEMLNFRINGQWDQSMNFCRNSVVPLAQMLSEGDSGRLIVYMQGPLLQGELLAAYEWILHLDQPGPYYISEAYNPPGEGYIYQRLGFVPQSWEQLKNLATDKRIGLGSDTNLACAFFCDNRPQDFLRYNYFTKHENHDVLREAQYVVDYDKDFDAFAILFRSEHGESAKLMDAIQRTIGGDLGQSAK